MMRIMKKEKKGFTLLEVMLAVAILLVATSMILSGFLVTFNYSNNTSVFAKLGSQNYSKSIQSLANIGTSGDIAVKFSTVGTTPVGITCSTTACGDSFKNYNLVMWSNASPIGGEGALTYDTATDASVTSTSRYAFSYSPIACPGCGNGQGTLRKYKDKTTGKTYWFCYNSSSDTNMGCGYKQTA